MKKWVGNFLMVAGLFLVVVVSYGVLENQHHQKELIQSFTSIKTEAAVTPELGVAANSIKETNKNKLPNQVKAILRIPKIELELAVLKGATPENLNRALGMIDGLDEPGVVGGSAAIAGHQSHIFGQFFNRLNELKIGDQFEIETNDEVLEYEVFGIEVVKPENVEILKSQKGVSLMSLVTCYPERSNKYRLVVQGRKVTNGRQ